MKPHYKLRIKSISPAIPSLGLESTSVLYLKSDTSVIEIYTGELDRNTFISWYRNNASAILSEAVPPFPIGDEESLVIAHRRALNDAPDVYVSTPENAPESVFWRNLEGWEESHFLPFCATQGTIVPNICFGVGSKGPEVSCEPRTWTSTDAGYFTGLEWSWRHTGVDLKEFSEWIEVG